MSNWSNYQKPNIGLLFYKRIYKEGPIKEYIRIKEKVKDSDEDELVITIPDGVKTSPFDDFYNDLLKAKAGDFEQIQNFACNPSFTLYTTYPGLLIGSGYQHDTKARGDFKIGFFFDHTTGQPVIPGRSIKGILRSLFELDMPAKANEKAFTGQKSVDAIKFICDEIIEDPTMNETEQKKWQSLKSSLTIKTLTKLKIETFGDERDENGDKAMGGNIFFDSVINIEKTGKSQRVFSNDFITPHDNPLKNPTPLQFLKVLPNIAFDFKFVLNGVGEWTNEIKEALFKRILLTMGAGAKTNVGYGQFITEEDKNKLEQSSLISTEQKKQKPVVGTKKYQDHEKGFGYQRKKEEKIEYDRLKKYEGGPKRAEQAKKEMTSTLWPDVKDIKPNTGSITAKIIAIDETNLIVQPYVKGLKDGYTLKITIGRYDETPYKKEQEIQIQISKIIGQKPDIVLQGKILKQK